MGSVFWPHAMMVPIERLSPRNTVCEVEILLQMRKSTHGDRVPAPKYGSDEAITKLHFQIAAIERLTQVSINSTNQRGCVFVPADN